MVRIFFAISQTLLFRLSKKTEFLCSVCFLFSQILPTEITVFNKKFYSSLKILNF